ncbi:hypothetical protein KSP39_PZI011984 [Platanthera zijinensis]|uniref:Uncharacterized protein n=1 Tax=Platanthera zijinensis TaxID=2320716 RepID=A0AAP0BGP6_9ASPA
MTCYGQRSSPDKHRPIKSESGRRSSPSLTLRYPKSKPTIEMAPSCVASTGGRRRAWLTSRRWEKTFSLSSLPPGCRQMAYRRSRPSGQPISAWDDTSPNSKATSRTAVPELVSGAWAAWERRRFCKASTTCFCRRRNPHKCHRSSATLSGRWPPRTSRASRVQRQSPAG